MIIEVAFYNMRKFSAREQQVIQLMIEGSNHSHNYLPINVYNDIFYRKKVEFLYGEDRSYLVFYRQNTSSVTPNELFEIENDIMEVSLLLSYLCDNGLIYLIEDTDTNKLSKAGGFLKGGLTAISKELDPKISNILFESLNHRVFVGNTLKEIAANKFKSIEERTLEEAKRQSASAKRQTRLSYIAILIAIVAPIIGSYISFWSSKNMVTNVKIDSCQTASIIECLDNIGNRIESVQIRDTTDLGNQKDMIRPPK